MRIITLDKKTIFKFFFCVLFLFVLTNAFSHCLKLVNKNQALCNTQFPKKLNLVATINDGGLTWIETPNYKNLIPNQYGAYESDIIALIAFKMVALLTPELQPNGNEFCASNKPTIASLSSNLVGSETVIWYDAAVGGTAYASSDLLQNGMTYYGSDDLPSNIESTSRLAVTVDLTKCNDIEIPDGFSPNGDGINDSFVIKNIDLIYPNFNLEIYNRYGNVVYQGNIKTPDWDGNATAGGLKMGNGGLPVGVYFYVLNYNDGSTKPTQGRIYLSR